jgi:hypothetical protein
MPTLCKRTQRMGHPRKGRTRNGARGTRRWHSTRDPSLRLKDGSARDDAGEEVACQNPNCPVTQPLENALHVEYIVEWIPHMQIVQIVLDKKLLHAADQAAKRTQQNRSALVRDALREHLRRLELRASEERDRQGYSRHSQAGEEARGWEAEATWPRE